MRAHMHTCVRRCWPCVCLTQARKTLASLFKYKIAVGGLQTLAKRILSSENTLEGFPMAEFSPLKVSAWIKKLGSILHLSISSNQGGWTSFRATTNFWIPTRQVFHFNGVEICPTIEKFNAIMGEPTVNTLILPTVGEDLIALVQALLGVSLDTA